MIPKIYFKCQKNIQNKINIYIRIIKNKNQEIIRNDRYAYNFSIIKK